MNITGVQRFEHVRDLYRGIRVFLLEVGFVLIIVEALLSRAFTWSEVLPLLALGGLMLLGGAWMLVDEKRYLLAYLEKLQEQHVVNELQFQHLKNLLFHPDWPPPNDGGD